MKSVAIVLAGGVGSRLWPLSTESKPKYLLPLNNSQSILGRHLQKISELNFDLIYIVTSHHAFQEVKKEVLELNISNLELIIEPIQKNTAPSIMFASELIERRLGKNINLSVEPEPGRGAFFYSQQYHCGEELYDLCNTRGKFLLRTDLMVGN